MKSLDIRYIIQLENDCKEKQLQENARVDEIEEMT